MKATTRQLAHRREIHAEAIEASETFCLYWLDGKHEFARGRNAADAITRAGYGAGAMGALDTYTQGPIPQYIWHEGARKWDPIAPPPKPRKPRKPRPKLSRKVVTSVRLLPEQIAALKLAGSMDKGITAAMRDAARYRWVRTRGAWDSEIALGILSEDPAKYDAAIDAELQRTLTEVKA